MSSLIDSSDAIGCQWKTKEKRKNVQILKTRANFSFVSLKGIVLLRFFFNFRNESSMRIDLWVVNPFGKDKQTKKRKKGWLLQKEKHFYWFFFLQNLEESDVFEKKGL